MGFGLVNKDDNKEESSKELEHDVSDTLKWQSWKTLKVGQGVQSIVNGVKGFISCLDDNYKVVEIDWDNGNKSEVNHYDLSKVICI